MASDLNIDCHEEQEMQKLACEAKKMMMVEEQDAVEMQEGKRAGVGLYPGQELSGEDEVQKGSLGVAEDEDMMMAEIETDLIFSDDAFPSLPDFPCLSSPSNAACPSSSSSSNSSSSASSVPWALGRQDHQQHAEGQTSSSAVEDVPVTLPSTPSDRKHPLESLASDCSMYQFSGMDLLGSTDESWDPLSLFPDDGEINNIDGDEPILQQGVRWTQQGEELIQQQHHRELQLLTLEEGDGGDKGGGCISQDLAMVFLEWLRDNKETISPQDLRSIKLRRSTIDCAVRSLGGGKDGMKKLLKLILTWVQNNHLQKKRRPSTDLLAGEEEELEITNLYQQTQAASISPLPDLVQAPVSDPHEGLVPNSCQSFLPVATPGPAIQGPCSPWAPPGDPCGGEGLYSTAASTTPQSIQSFAPQSSFQAVEPVCPWSQALPQYPVFSTSPHPTPSLYTSGGLPGQYPVGHLFHQGPGESLVRLASSATKEARKKRMARQRRFSSLHHIHNHHHHHHHQRNQHHQSTHDQHQHQIHLQQCAPALAGEGLCSQTDAHGSWTFRPSTSPSSQQVVATGGATATTMPQQRQHDFPPGNTADRRQVATSLNCPLFHLFYHRPNLGKHSKMPVFCLASLSTSLQ